MPTISMFYGILISMFFEIKEKHHLPHIHVRYQNFRASVGIEDGDLLAGELPPRQLRMVQVWVDLHREELLAARNTRIRQPRVSMAESVRRNRESRKR